ATGEAIKIPAKTVVKARSAKQLYDGVLQLFRDPRLDDGLGGNLAGLAPRRVAAHARLALLHHQLHHSGQHEFARALQIFLRQRRQLVEVLAGLCPLDVEALGEVRKEFGFAHPAGVRHRCSPSKTPYPSSPSGQCQLRPGARIFTTCRRRPSRRFPTRGPNATTKSRSSVPSSRRSAPKPACPISAKSGLRTYPTRAASSSS